jgi:hypothetical protein
VSSVEECPKELYGPCIVLGLWKNMWVLLLIPIATNPCVAKLLELMMDETTPSTYSNGTSELKMSSSLHALLDHSSNFCDTYYSKYNQTRYACH